MGGGLMQLVAYGAQDVYLTGNPQITFFKVVYRRHTNFACEAIEQTFNGTPTFGSKATVQITRNGDLVTKMWLHTTLTASATATLRKWPGYALINSVELQIGGTKIDKHYGQWMAIWADLTVTDSKLVAHDALVGTEDKEVNGSDEEIFVPLQFFCCRNDGLALPLIALQYHDVRLEFDFADQAAVQSGGNNNLSMTNTSLLVNYVYLDSEERKRFAQASHEYLIEQLQFTGAESGIAASATKKFRLNFNHPVKELVWVQKDITDIANVNYEELDENTPIASALLQLNGHDRFSAQNEKFFSKLQPYTHHTASPSNGVNVYSFALNPEEHQPSGTCNFSRIDNATLTITNGTTTTENGSVFIYGVNYNVLRIMSGMGGVAYSN
jgi:hypothetical protein